MSLSRANKGKKILNLLAGGRSDVAKAAYSCWKCSQQNTAASTSILFGLNLSSKYMLESLISINLLFIKR